MKDKHGRKKYGITGFIFLSVSMFIFCFILFSMPSASEEATQGKKGAMEPHSDSLDALSEGLVKSTFAGVSMTTIVEIATAPAAILARIAGRDSKDTDGSKEVPHHKKGADYHSP
jgi:hypothetical protein